MKLSEEMVMSRCRGVEIGNVRKLNCWGNQINDISIVRNMPNLEVLALSKNNVSTLVDLQYCTNLAELFVRDNNIADLNEIVYLRQLPRLRSLWLEDNPCARRADYRLAVLRALPRLQRLDNADVDPQEVQRAASHGPALLHPDHADQEQQQQEEEEQEEEEVCQTERVEYARQEVRRCSPEQQQQQRQLSRDHSSSSSLEHHQHNVQQQQQQHHQEDAVLYRRQSEVPSMNHSASYEARGQRLSYANRSPCSAESPALNSSSHRSHRASYAGPYSRAEECTSAYSTPLSYERSAGAADNDGYRSVEVSHASLRASMVAADLYSDPGSVRHIASRPRKKSSNVLSAVLCLIKELDTHGLEVVETAARCRIQELED